MCVMQILISCVDQEQNPHQLTKAQKPKTPTFFPPSLYPSKIHPYVHILVCQKRKSEKIPWKISGLVLCMWKYLESYVCTRGGRTDADTLFFGDGLKHLYISLFHWKSFWLQLLKRVILLKYKDSLKAINHCGLDSRERTRTFQIKQKWVPFCINPVGMCLHKWTNV